MQSCGWGGDGVGMEKVGGQLGEEALTNISLRGVGEPITCECDLATAEGL